MVNKCCVCDVEVDEDYNVKNDDGEFVCDNCYKVCKECSEIIIDGDYWTDNMCEIVCQGCIDEYYDVCEGCDELVYSDELQKYTVNDYMIVAMNGRQEKRVHEKWLCEDCHERLKE